VVAALLGFVVPGAGHLYAGASRRGLVLFCGFAALFVAGILLLAARPFESLFSVVSPWLLGAVLLVNAAVLAFRLFAIVDAWRWCAGRLAGLAGVALIAIVVVAVVPHVAAAYAAIRAYDVVDTVFADEEPQDVLPARGLFLVAASPRDGDDEVARPAVLPEEPSEAPVRSTPLPGVRRVFLGSDEPLEHRWITILLIGSDHGPGQAGDRTDTMIVAALQRGTGRAAVLGVPRNLVGVPVGSAESPVPFREPLNALYSFARTRPGLFPGGRDPGATALKQSISRLLGIRVDYYAMVDLDGFVDMVDALGGVTIRVKERLVDEVTRPEWGETKPRIDVYPGRTYRFTGRTALAYVRSRKASSDYRRMARQRCFLSALANQLDVGTVLRHFRSLAAVAEESVRSDIPLDRVPDLVETVAAVDRRETLTETFGWPYFAGRRAGDNYPIPNVAKMQATVRAAILHPELARDHRGVETVRASC
jgi:polyisoprenyl-teichoic acid--peptidoglycan teichoic acid transferase